MKKIMILVIIFFGVLTYNTKVSAAGDRWVETLNCPAGYEDSATHNAKWGVQTSADSQRDYNYQQLAAMDKVCISETVTAIADYDRVFQGYIYYCKGDQVLGRDNKMSPPGYTTRNRSGTLGTGIGGTGKMCCPSAYPYIRWRALDGNFRCCDIDPANLITDDNQILPSDFNVPRCGRDSIGNDVVGKDAEPVSSVSKLGIDIYGGDFINSSGIKYLCPKDKCFVSSGLLTITGADNVVDDKTDKQCVDNYGPDTSGIYCIDGIAVSKDYYDTYVAIGIGAVNTCNDFADPAEVTNCLACYKNCPEKDTCSYSSLGCIQTTQNGIIVRIFQIGLGIVGAMAILRFIQAALLRQTADPSKIQESYDIITSLIIGIVVLLGSTVILRFIGVDILQMLPF